MLGESKNMPCCFFLFFFLILLTSKETQTTRKNSPTTLWLVFPPLQSPTSKPRQKEMWLHKLLLPAAYTPTVNWVETYKHSIC